MPGPRLLRHRLQRLSVRDCEFARGQAKSSQVKYAPLVLRDAASPGIGQFAAIQSAAPSFGVELIPLTVHDGAEIERGVSSNGALIVTARWSMDVPFQRCCHHERLFYTGDRSPFNLGTVNDPARIRVECVASMHGAAIVPWDEIADCELELSRRCGGDRGRACA